jgi:hypothetical protein
VVTIFGSSNWTSASSDSQAEHNYFTTKLWFFDWFVDQFDRKWNNTNPTGVPETRPFVPLPPDRPAYRLPVDRAVGAATTGTRLVWHGGPWAHSYDVYFGTSPIRLCWLPTSHSARAGTRQRRRACSCRR